MDLTLKLKWEGGAGNDQGKESIKAPRRMLFEIHRIMVTPAAVENCYLGIFDRELEHENIINWEFDEIDSAIIMAPMLSSLTGEYNGPQQYLFPIPLVCKRLSCIIISANEEINVGPTYIHINYDLVKATKHQLVWEWVRSFRR